MTKSIPFIHLVAAGALASLVACSAQQIKTLAPLDTNTASDLPMVLTDAVVLKAKNAKETNLRAGTRWMRVGSIEQGDVYDSNDQVVIVNSFDVHEASLVVSDGMAVGYFLNVEETFVEAKPVKISLQAKGVGE
ncbi:MAG: hypothetical protein K0U72_07505 [Gammaproteobacteria bacterium]|nr:hypothetical protein [Gammaproteobacteria bacterium]